MLLFWNKILIQIKKENFLKKHYFHLIKLETIWCKWNLNRHSSMSWISIGDYVNFQVTTSVDPQTNETIIVGTAMRNNPYYATYYVVWSKLILTDLVPYFIIILANSFIVVKIVKSSRFRARIVRNRNKTTVLNREVSLKIMYKNDNYVHTYHVFTQPISKIPS